MKEKRRAQLALEIMEYLHKKYMKTSDPLMLNFITEVQKLVLELGITH